MEFPNTFWLVPTGFGPIGLILITNLTGKQYCFIFFSLFFCGVRATRVVRTAFRTLARRTLAVKKQEVSDEVEGRGVTGPNLERWQCKQTGREQFPAFLERLVNFKIEVGPRVEFHWELLKLRKPPNLMIFCCRDGKHGQTTQKNSSVATPIRM